MHNPSNLQPHYTAACFAGFAEAPFPALAKRLTDATFGPDKGTEKTVVRRGSTVRVR
jgi:hypothetical protein